MIIRSNSDQVRRIVKSLAETGLERCMGSKNVACKEIMMHT